MSTAAPVKVPGFCGLCIARCGSVDGVQERALKSLELVAALFQDDRHDSLRLIFLHKVGDRYAAFLQPRHPTIWRRRFPFA